jgi:hypothetical protein
MKNRNLGIAPAALGRPAQLRADGIRIQDLIQLGRALAEGDTRSMQLLDALEDLGKLAESGRRDGDLIDAIGDVVTLGGLDAAVMDLTPSDVGQLAVEAWEALPAAPVDAPAAPQPDPDWVKHTKPTGVPQQQDRRAS